MKKQHILVISQYFYPENFRINDICKEWINQGNEVTVVTGIPNYPQGKFYEGYGLFKKRKEIVDGINVIRLPIFARGSSSLGLIFNYLSFVISGWFWKCFTKIKADKVFVFGVSPATQAFVGVWYSKKRKVPCCFYVQDLWPESIESVAGIKNQKILRTIGKMVDYIYQNCDKIFATSKSCLERIKERNFDNKEKVVYLPQYAEDFYKPFGESKHPLIPDDDRFKIVFTGNIGKAQGLDILPDAAKLLKGQQVLFVIVGDGRYKNELLEQVRANDVEELFLFIDRQPAENIPPILAACDAAFVSFMDTEIFRMVIPAKLQSYMACAIPIISAASGETDKIIREADCGVCSEIGNSKALAENILDFKNKVNNKAGENAVLYYKNHFDKSLFFEVLQKEF